MTILNDYMFKEVILANGAKVPLKEAAEWYAALRNLAETPETARLLYSIRQKAIGHQIGDAELQMCLDEDLINTDGNLNPVLSAVILSSIRGQDSAVYLDSPFTESSDRSFGDFVFFRGFLRASMSVGALKQFFADEQAQEEQLDAAVEKWARNERINRRLGIKEALPPL